MKHYVVYHNAEAMGYSLDEPNDGANPDCPSILTNKPVKNLPGNIIWLISGEGKPRQYRLHSRFKVKDFEDSPNESFKYSVRGEKSIPFDPAILLNEFNWFPQFLRSQSNFSLGLNEIRDEETINTLEYLTYEYVVEHPELQHDYIVEHPELQEAIAQAELQQIELLSAEDYKTALTALHDQMSETELRLLKGNYVSPDYTTTATQLAHDVGFTHFNSVNLHYGRLAGKFFELLQVFPRTNLSVFVIFEKRSGEWHWTLRPQLVEAIRELGWFGETHEPNVLQDLEQFRQTYETIEATTREAIIQSRIGQGQFRSALIEYWKGCAVTGCQLIEVLRASHIKPWRESENTERLDPFNGLLLVPNLDTAFDLGFISFTDEGNILISNQLDEVTALQLGINHSLKLRRIEEQHRRYLKIHRNRFFPSR